MRLCEVDECQRQHYARGLCHPHYKRWWKRGTLTAPPRSPYRTDEQRLRDHFTPGAPDECWLWTGQLNWNGYGVGRKRDRTGTTAHRLVYELLVGPIPEGYVLDHTCHDSSRCFAGRECLHRRCVNPAHLEPVTVQENLRRSRQTRPHDCSLHG